MFAKLALLFIVIPVVELALLVRLGSLIGFWPTMAIIIATGLAGAALARLAGVHVILQIRGELAAGRMPMAQMLDGLLVLVGGVVLLTPGLLTDIFGFALLIPWSRRIVRNWLRSRMQHMIETQQIGIMTMNSPFAGPVSGRGPFGRDVHDRGDFTRRDADDREGPPPGRAL